MATMYVPRHFAVDDEQSLEIVRGIRTADLVTMTDAGLVATFLPLLHEADGGPMGSLLGHLARSNDQWRSAPRGEALAIARGLDFYVSPSWYASKREHGRVVPTWNYTTAHVHGELLVHDDAAWVESLVRRLTERHEAGRPDPWSVDDAPAEYVAGQLRAIVGVELVITRVEVKDKMSQNRPDADIDGVVAALTEQGDAEAARKVANARR
jgi:transcriptional regulator